MTRLPRQSDPDRTFKAIADTTRREIIELLAENREGLNIGQLSAHFDTTRQGVTKHIKMLEQAGLVNIEAHGRERMCRADLFALRTVYEWVQLYEQFWTERLDRLGEHLDQSG